MAEKKSTHTDDARNILIRQYKFSPKTRALIVLDLQDKSLVQFLEEASVSLDFSCITVDSLVSGAYTGYDACVSDGLSEKLDLVQAVKSGIVPILSKNHGLSASFYEFDPMKFVGNAFIFDTLDKFKILEKIIRYLENIRYSGDKRTLLNNLKNTF